MDKRQNIIITEIIKACKAAKTDKFDFVIEDWGVMWTPWMIYVNSVSLSLSENLVQSSDFDIFVKEGIIEINKVFDFNELDKDSLDLSRVRFKILKTELE